MAATATVNVRGRFEGLVGITKSIAIAATSAASIDKEYQVELESGDNDISVPATAVGVIIIFATASTVTKTLKQAANDEGLVLRPNGFNIITFDLSAVPLVTVMKINASAADTGNITTFIFF